MKEKVEIVSTQNVLGKELTVYGTLENPLFLAKDVAEWIDYAKTGNGSFDVSNMVKSVDDDEKLIQTMFVSGQERDCMFLTENGLYEVLMLSRKPIAKAFKKEVKRILHELRVNGTVVSPRVALDSPEEQAASFQKALDSAVKHAMELAENWFQPQIEKAESERDAAIRQRHMLDDRRAATAMQRNSVLARRNNALMEEKQELLERVDEINEELGVAQYDAERYWHWRNNVGRRPKGWLPPEFTQSLF